MKKYLTFFISLLAVVSLFGNYFFYQQIKDQNMVVRVIDGDTFDLKDGRRIRLLGIDAPEIDLCGGSQAKKLLEELVLGKRVKIKEGDYRDYGRIMALVYVNNLLANEVILKQGWARPLYAKNPEKEKLISAYSEAKNKKRGIFEKCQKKDPIDLNCPIKGNIDSNTKKKFYHLPNCYHYKETIISLDLGEKFFCTEDEAILAGFKKAAGCK